MTPKFESPINRSTSVELYQTLSEPIPPEALHQDSGRGFALTSIKAAYILERLNQVFGLVGYGWRYAHGPHRLEGPKSEALVEVMLQWRVCDDPAELSHPHCYPIHWGTHVDEKIGQVCEGWYFDKSTEAVWSEPIPATGGSATNRKGSVPYTDAFRGAVTNGITKAASRLGIGIEIWKGEEEAPPAGNSPGQDPKRKRQVRRSKGAKGFANLSEMCDAAQAELNKLRNVPHDKAAEAKQVAMLAQVMKTTNVQMQPAVLLAILWGPNPEGLEGLPQRRVMAAVNFLQLPLMTDSAIEILNASRASAS